MQALSNMFIIFVLADLGWIQHQLATEWSLFHSTMLSFGCVAVSAINSSSSCIMWWGAFVTLHGDHVALVTLLDSWAMTGGDCFQVFIRNVPYFTFSLLSELLSVGPLSKHSQSPQFHDSEWIWLSKVVCQGPSFPKEFKRNTNVLAKIYIRVGRTSLESKGIEQGLGLSRGS